MNYRHQFHAGNFADVMKHALLLLLFRGMQRKEKGFLFLDTHAGRGRYDLASAARGDSLERKPEWPEGIGRIWQAQDLGPALAEYLDAVRKFNAYCGADPKAPAPSFYPGSPLLASETAREQDRLAFCEKHPEEFAALKNETEVRRTANTQLLDGYTALKALLPPPEKRALVLIDPPFESKDEFRSITGGMHEALRRFPSGTYAIWYPLTERARVDAFFEELQSLDLPPSFAAELEIAGEFSSLKMRGCGLVVVNPPWKIESEIADLLEELTRVLGQEPGAAARLRWLIPE